ncbi:hypothetical protein Bca52824_018178 [Brassica carinata]|uniref:Uncharacterized protein n=1 Tax=Brassica carinata TaxID=52824 RepID=A0A8X7VPF3_BRACI|nr:hypothetical protein Bca52824_018178 [Brassica carinata]
MGNESGYGSEPGYRGNVEFGYGDEYDDEEEDVKLLFWGDEHFGVICLPLNELDAAPTLFQKHQQIAKMEEDSVKEKIIVCYVAKAFRGSKKDRSIAE